MEESLKTLLSQGFSEIDTKFCTPSILGRLEKYYDQVELFNSALGLVNASGKELVTRHILDSIIPLTCMQNLISSQFQGNVSIADLGSGNGMPGLVLSCVATETNPSWKFHLVERMGRRAGFLRNTLAVTGLADKTEVVQSDINDIKTTFDVLIMRAFRPLDAIHDRLLEMCHENSLVFIWTAGEKNGVSVLRKTAAGVFQKIQL